MSASVPSSVAVEGASVFCGLRVVTLEGTTEVVGQLVPFAWLIFPGVNAHCRGARPLSCVHCVFENNRPQSLNSLAPYGEKTVNVVALLKQYATEYAIEWYGRNVREGDRRATT